MPGPVGSDQGSALLVLDVQTWIVERLRMAAVVPKIREAVTAGRAAGIPIVHVAIQFRDGSPDVSSRNKVFARRDPQREASVEIHPQVARAEGEIVVVKKRVSAFAGSDLDVVLRSLEIDRLVLVGISTGGVVLSTVRFAADCDYRLTVLADACADPDEEVHRVLMTKVFPPQAEVITVSDWRASLARADAGPGPRRAYS